MADGKKMGALTASMSKEMLGVTPTEHKEMKELGDRDSLRDHFDTVELAVTTLGERAAKAIIVARETTTAAQTTSASMAGAKIAGDAAREIEKQINRPIANKNNFLSKPAEAAALPVATPEVPKAKKKKKKSP